MKLVNAPLGLCIDFEENTLASVVIENVRAYRNFIEELYLQINGAEGNFVLSEKDKVQKINKVMDIIINLFSVSMNDRKITSALYSNLTEIGNEIIEKKHMLGSEMLSLLEDIVSKEQYSNIEYTFDFEWEDYFKLFKVRIGSDFESLLEKYVEYIKVVSSLTNIKILCFVGLSNYMSQQEIAELQTQAKYSKVQLLLIENRGLEKIDGEIRFIIDKDNCIIEQ